MYVTVHCPRQINNKILLHISYPVFHIHLLTTYLYYYYFLYCTYFHSLVLYFILPKFNNVPYLNNVFSSVILLLALCPVCEDSN